MILIILTNNPILDDFNNHPKLDDFKKLEKSSKFGCF